MLAGCQGPPAEAQGGNPDRVTEITDPNDFANSSLPGSHVHNYWRGAAAVDVFDTTVGLTHSSPSVCPSAFVPPEVQTDCIELDPLAEGVVPPGARQLDFSVSWESTAVGPGAVARLHYEAPNQTGGFATGELELSPTASASLNITEELTDLPHTPQTRWRLWASIARGTPGTYDAHFVVRAIRGTENLTIAPPHPDHWGNQTTLHLNSYQGPFNEVLGQNGLPSGDHPGYEFSPVDSIVPPSTTRIAVIAYLNTTSPGQVAPDPVLNWRGADRRDPEQAAMPPSLASETGNSQFWQWDVVVEPRMWDSPYAAASSWRIFIDWHGGLAPASATFTQGEASIQVRAERQP